MGGSPLEGRYELVTQSEAQLHYLIDEPTRTEVRPYRIFASN